MEPALHCGCLRLVFVCSRLEWLGIKHTDIEDDDLAIPAVSCNPKSLRRWGAVYLRCCPPACLRLAGFEWAFSPAPIKLLVHRTVGFR